MALPEAYKIGWIPFLHSKIWLDSKPLIPRPETEYWVNEAIQESRIKNHESIIVLDLCAGSGAIGVSVLQENPNAEVDFVEIEERHHKTIEKNVLENIGNLNRIKIFGGDLFENISSKYDAILTNPPYINPSKVNRVEESVLNYEPHKALFGGKDGIEIIQRIIEEAPKFLVRGGLLYIEHEPEQEDEIHRLASALGYSHSESLRDQYKLIRYSLLVC